MRGDRDFFEAEVLETVTRPLSQFAITSGTGHVRLVGEDAVRIPDEACRRQREKPPLDFCLNRCARPRETERRIEGALPGRGEQARRRNAQRNDRPGHFFKALRISLAAFWPDPAVMPPPGWVPAPHK